MKSLTVFAFERLCVLTFIPCSGSLCVGCFGCAMACDTKLLIS